MLKWLALLAFPALWLASLEWWYRVGTHKYGGIEDDDLSDTEARGVRWGLEAWRWIMVPVPLLAFGVVVYAGGSMLDGLFSALVALNVGLLAFTVGIGVVWLVWLMTRRAAAP